VVSCYLNKNTIGSALDTDGVDDVDDVLRPVYDGADVMTERLVLRMRTDSSLETCRTCLRYTTASVAAALLRPAAPM